MHSILIATALLALAGLSPPAIAAANAVAEPGGGYKRAEVCFVLDTTGSMSGLLESAKQKIWFIASEIVNAPSRPEVRFCLLAFRDRGDDYVTRHVDLTGDLDAVYAELVALQADGGGDQPEAVNQALLEAVDATSWTASADALKVIFLVGDAPPHTDYDEPQYPQIAARAASLGILINPVLCGDDHGARQAFQRIATLGGGEAAELAQPERVQRTHTPVDQDLAALGQRLDRTVIPYAAEQRREEIDAAARLTGSLDHSAAADRAAFTAARARLLGGDGDLLDALDENRLAIADLEPARLPPALRSMTEAELVQHLATVRAEREGLRRVIRSLLEERRALIAAQAAKQTDGGFDALVAQIVQRQLRDPPPTPARGARVRQPGG